MDRLSHRPQLPLDERCAGCPAILACEIGRNVLKRTMCDNAYHFTTIDEDEVGCRKGPPMPDKILIKAKTLYLE